MYNLLDEGNEFDERRTVLNSMKGARFWIRWKVHGFEFDGTTIRRDSDKEAQNHFLSRFATSQISLSVSAA